MTMALMISSGLMLGVILDTYQVLKHRFRMRGWVVSLVDLLYWSVSAALVFSLLMWSNWGELRFYVFIAVCLGFFLYYQWFSQQVIRLIRWLIDLMEKILYGIARALYILIWIPLVYLVLFLRNLLRFLLQISWKFIKVLFIPIWWLIRPVWMRVQPILYPYIQKIKQGFWTLRAWWKKIRTKGE
jgi:spore cortex biosynthesis protein YabQ